MKKSKKRGLKAFIRSVFIGLEIREFVIVYVHEVRAKGLKPDDEEEIRDTMLCLNGVWVKGPKIKRRRIENAGDNILKGDRFRAVVCFVVSKQCTCT